MNFASLRGVFCCVVVKLSLPMIFRAATCRPSLFASLVFCDASSWIFRERTKIQGIQSASHYISISLSRLYMVLLSNKVITWGYFWHYFESQLMFIFVWFSSLPTSDCTDRFMIPRLVFLRLRLPAAVFPLHIRCMEMYEVCGSFILTNLWHTRPKVQSVAEVSRWFCRTSEHYAALSLSGTENRLRRKVCPYTNWLFFQDFYRKSLQITDVYTWARLYLNGGAGALLGRALSGIPCVWSSWRVFSKFESGPSKQTRFNG